MPAHLQKLNLDFSTSTDHKRRVKQRSQIAAYIAGPFDSPPIANLQCSGVGVIPKKTGGCRMIMHLSAPRDHSINDGILKEDFSLHYSTIDDAVQMIHQLGSNTLLAKIDIKSAFRTIPVRVEDQELLGINWRDKFYVDCCLPFGLRSASYIFNQCPGMDPAPQSSHLQHNPLPGRLPNSRKIRIRRM